MCPGVAIAVTETSALSTTSPSATRRSGAKVVSAEPRKGLVSPGRSGRAFPVRPLGDDGRPEDGVQRRKCAHVVEVGVGDKDVADGPSGDGGDDGVHVARERGPRVHHHQPLAAEEEGVRASARERSSVGRRHAGDALATSTASP